MFDNPAFGGHERLLQVYDRPSGLRAIIAIHSTALGPAAGGCRLWSYANSNQALIDALKLSRGMSFKNAMAGLKLGGGKAVILGPLEERRRADAFVRFGEAIESLAGGYITAEDVGVGVQDMEMVATRTRFVSGLSAGRNGVGGDPSPYTAKGVAIGIEAAVNHAFNRASLEGLTVAVQGLGGVGLNLCRELHARGARMVVADVNDRRVEEACDCFGAERASVEDILYADVDIVAPCALGGVIDARSAECLRAPIVAGGANNQLASDEIGEVLKRRNITYAPDYVINAGGIIAVSAEYHGGVSSEEVDAKIAGIGDRIGAILRLSDEQRRSAQALADDMARTLVKAAQQARDGSER